MRLFRRRIVKTTARDWLFVALGVVVTLGVIGIISTTEPTPTPVAYQAKGITAAWIPDTVKHWSKTIDAMAKRYNVDPNLVAIIMTMESGGDAKAKSEAGAVGLMQVTPPTASDIARKFLQKPVTKYDLQDPETNIEFGTAYLAHLRAVFGDKTQAPSWNATVELVAAGYNGGPGTAAALEKGEGLRDTQPVVYSRDAYNMWRERVSASSPTFDRWKERGGASLLEAAKASQQ